MMKKALIVLIHVLTSFAIFDACGVLGFFFYDYDISNLVKCFLIGCALIAADYLLCRIIIRKNFLEIRNPKLLHLTDLIFPVGMGAFIVSGLLGDIPLWIRRPDNPETRYSIAYVILLIIIEALLITDRVFLIKFTAGREKP